MCYSARVKADYKKYVRAWGADINLQEYFRLYWDRSQGTKTSIPKAMDASFLPPASDQERDIVTLITEFDRQRAGKLEQEVFKQRNRVVSAQRSLQTKSTKKAQDDARIGSEKVAWALRKLGELKRIGLVDSDSQIFPGWYAPVMVIENGKRVVKPMRYQCRLAGKPVMHDAKYPGTYNARRDNLGGFWKGLFGYTHGIIIVDSFFENVSLHRVQGRELVPGEKDHNVILEFKPQTGQEMLAACLWSHWTGKGEPDLLSFAAITDDPPEEISIAGHDRCIIPIKPENVEAWLNPDPRNLAAAYAILDDRARPYYEFRMAA